MSRPFRLRLVLVGALALSLIASTGTAAAKTVWLCKPGIKNDPCTPGLKTTYYSPSLKKLRVGKPKADRPPKIDCFYVYPTVSDQPTAFANLDIDPELRSIALFQAARYSQHCRVFAPVYRQATVAGLGGVGGTTADAERAYNDVLSAWRTYLRKYNKGRGVVIMGHSQGTFVLRRMIREEVDPKPKVRRKLVSTILLGGNVTVKKGKDLGGDFKHIRACRSKRQLGCVIAFSTFNAPAPQDSVFGRTGNPKLQVLCTNPAALGGGSAPVTPINPSAPFAPGTAIAIGITLLGVDFPRPATPWAEEPGAYTARCSTAGGASVLQTTARKGAPVFKASPVPSWGLHLTDANIALRNLVDLVGRQATEYTKR